MSWTNLFLLLMFICCYVVFGGSVFYVLESSSSRERAIVSQARQFLAKYKDVQAGDLQGLLKNIIPQDLLPKIKTVDSDQNEEEFTSWSFMNSVFFATSVITTIGYGDLSPTTFTGRFFVVIFGIIGIPLLMMTIAELSRKILAAVEEFSSHPPASFKNLPVVFRHSRNVETIKVAIIIFGGSVLFILLPSLAFSFLEDWSFGESMYYGFVTLSTIGFGDFIAGVERGLSYPMWYLFFRQVWLFFGLVWLSSLYTLIQQECYALLNRARSMPWNDKEALPG